MIKQEYVEPIKDDLQELIDDYYGHGDCHDGVSPRLDIDWQTYIELDRYGKLVVLVDRDDDDKNIRGFAMYIVTHHPHYRSTAMAMCDTLAVYKHMRGNGIGSGLVKHAEQVLKSMGITHMMHNYRTLYEVDSLFPKLGFTLIEHSYLKKLG